MFILKLFFDIFWFVCMCVNMTYVCLSVSSDKGPKISYTPNLENKNIAYHLLIFKIHFSSLANQEKVFLFKFSLGVSVRPSVYLSVCLSVSLSTGLISKG